jgi:hypothetical protein
MPNRIDSVTHHEPVLFVAGGFLARGKPPAPANEPARK